MIYGGCNPDPLKDPKNRAPRKWLHYYIGEPMGIIKGFHFLDPLAGQGKGCWLSGCLSSILGR